MTQTVTVPPQEASAQLVWRKFQGALGTMTLVHISLNGEWLTNVGYYQAIRIAGETGLDPDRVRQIIQLYRINDIERRLFELVAARRVELARPVLTGEELQPVIDQVAQETRAATAWLWDRVYPAGSPGRLDLMA